MKIDLYKARVAASLSVPRERNSNNQYYLKSEKPLYVPGGKLEVEERSKVSRR
jgi:hypothetical protein